MKLLELEVELAFLPKPEKPLPNVVLPLVALPNSGAFVEVDVAGIGDVKLKVPKLLLAVGVLVPPNMLVPVGEVVLPTNPEPNGLAIFKVFVGFVPKPPLKTPADVTGGDG